jgi:cell division septation protein DedD
LVAPPAPPPAPPAVSPTPTVVAAPPAKPAPPPPAVATAAPAKPLTPPPARAAAGGSYRLQIGALRTDEAAHKEWERLKHTHADLLGGMGAVVSRAEFRDRGTFYRIQAGPIAEAAKAERLCSELKRRNVGCILVKP